MTGPIAVVKQPCVRAMLRERLDASREHVLETIDGLDEQALDTVAAPSGWTPRSMVNHLIYDVELFWIHAVLGADAVAISRLRDGWTAPSLPGRDLRVAYRAEAARGNQVLVLADLDAPPAWWPPADIFSGPPLGTGWEVVLRVLEETLVHAGHLDIARERLDGRQHLVVN